MSYTAASAFKLWLIFCGLSQLCHLFSLYCFLLSSQFAGPRTLHQQVLTALTVLMSVILRCCMLSFPSVGELAAIFTHVGVFFFLHQWQQDSSIIQHCCCSPLFYIQNWDRPLLSIRLLTYLFFHWYVIPAAVVMNLMFMAENLPPPFILSCQSQPSPHNRDMCSFSP